MQIKIKETAMLFITTIIMFISNLMATSIFIVANDMKYKWLYILLYSLIAIYIINLHGIKIKTTKRMLLFFLLWQLFVLSVFYSKYLFETFNFFEFVLYIVIIPIAFFVPSILKYKSVISLAYLISVIPFLYILSNGNTLGIMFTFAGAIVLIKLNEKKVNVTYIYLAIFIFSVLLFITESRSAIITFIVISGILLINKLFEFNASLISILRKMILVITTIFIMLLINPKLEVLLLNKYSSTTEDITSGRQDIWRDIIFNKSEVFGSNLNYTLVYNVRDAHNIFIQILGDYGWVSLVLFLILIMYLIYTINYKLKLEYIIFFTTYILLGLTENVLFIDNRFISIHILFFMYVGSLFNDVKTKPIKSEAV